MVLRIWDPCRLVRQVNQVGKLSGNSPVFHDPCWLVRQVKEVLPRRPEQPSSPAGQAGRGRNKCDTEF